jgi:hypothetical protein
VEFADRAARNEEIFRSVNEGIVAGAKQHNVSWPFPFHCECSSASCVETLSIAPHDYERITSKRFRFVVMPGHENAGVERIAETHEAFLVVEKTGEARDQIARDHPQHEE